MGLPNVAGADPIVAVNYGGMQAAADGFASALGKLTATWDALNQQLNTFATMNDGQFKNSFVAAQNQVNSGMTEMQDVLRRITQVIPAASEAYSAADKAAASYFA
jgi:WXG100 family type VII secretion target